MDINHHPLRSEEDAVTVNTAIKNLTLTDPAAVTELQQRRAVLCADLSVLPRIRTRGLAVLDNALSFHVPTALKDGQSVVRLLRRAIRALGALYQENQERLTTNEDVTMEEEQGSSEKVSELLQEDENKDGDDDMLDVEAHQSKPSSAQMPLETRFTKARATLNNRAALKQKRQRSALAMRAKVAEKYKQRKIDLVDRDKPLRLQQTASPAATNELITATTPSLLPSETQPTIATTPLTAPNHTRSMRQRTQQQMFPYHHDYEQSQGAQQPPTVPSVPEKPYKFTTTFHPTTGVPSLIVKFSFSALTSPELNRPMSSWPSPARGRGRKRGLTTVEEEEGKGKRKKNKQGKAENENGRGKGQHGYKSGATIPADSEELASGSATITRHDDLASSSPESIEATPPPTSATPSVPDLPPIPSYPTLPSKALPHFHRGVTIALENIAEESTASPARSLHTIVQELEDEVPQVENWEHVKVLEGGRWVYAVCLGLEGVWGEGDGDGDGDGDGEAAAGRGDAGDTGEIPPLDLNYSLAQATPSAPSADNTVAIHALMVHFTMWVEGEYARLMAPRR